MSENPYETPQTFETPPESNTEAESIRKEHINTEASVKAVGTLYYLVCLLLCVSLYGILSNGGSGAMVDLPLIAIIILLFFTARGIRRFKPWTRFMFGIVSGIAVLFSLCSGIYLLSQRQTISGPGLLGMALGLLIHGSILRLAFGKKGRMVFSEFYKEIIAATPHVKYKTSKLVWILLGILVAIFAGVIAIALFIK
jgi:hypothetical protein